MKGKIAAALLALLLAGCASKKDPLFERDLLFGKPPKIIDGRHEFFTRGKDFFHQPYARATDTEADSGDAFDWFWTEYRVTDNRKKIDFPIPKEFSSGGSGLEYVRRVHRRDLGRLYLPSRGWVSDVRWLPAGEKRNGVSE